MRNVRGGRYICKLVWFENLKKEDGLEYSGVNGRVILKRILKQDRGVGWISLAQDRSVAGCYDQGNEPLGCIKLVKFLEFLRNY
jgi:hypothetical protein